MSKLREIKERILVDGRDLCIDDDDWSLIRENLPADGQVSAEDLKVLIEMRTQARKVCRGFDQFFFPVLKSSILADGRISPVERFTLLSLLYGGGGIDDAERDFLRQLKKEVKESSPEFEAMYAQAMRD